MTRAGAVWRRVARLSCSALAAAGLLVGGGPEVAAGPSKPQPKPSCSQQPPSPAAQPRRCSQTVFNRLYGQVQHYCKQGGQAMSCKKQTDSCDSATEKVALGYGCTNARELVQQQCYRPGDAGYEGHMRQIAQANATLRNCLEVQEAKCQ